MPNALPDIHDAAVADLAVPHRRRDAERRLMAAGAAATGALRRGLRHDDPAVRVSCCRVLDHFLDAEALPELMANLDHPDPSVRAWALHALACDRCKEGSCRPGEDDSIPVALQMLADDPSRKVRYSALGLVAPAVHHRDDVLAALERVQRTDACPTNRKVAGWWLPGGSRYERTKPRPVRVTTGARAGPRDG